MAKIVVSGYMIRYPVAGNLLAYFHYVLGLLRLGHEVLYLEESGWPCSCYDPITRDYGDEPDTGLRILRAMMADCGVEASVCYVNRDSGKVAGAGWEDVKQMLQTANLLLNIGGVCWLPEFRLCRRRALIDMDPLFTQAGRFGGEGFSEYHLYFSYGANIGRPGCTVPTCDIDWLPTVPPVVPELWQGPVWGHSLPGLEGDETTGPGRPVATKAPMPSLSPQPEGDHSLQAFTTIANWSAYGGVTYEGRHYGQKDEEFLRLLDLPRRTSQRLELALSGVEPAVAERLRSAGWSVRNAGDVSTELPAYQAYILGSRGELSAAKHAYVQTRSGWFSDRSVCYLAAGCPVILQDTGFSDWLPTGWGVLAFSGLEEAAACIERVNADYPVHRHSAREIAEQMFSYQVVLPRLLETSLRVRVAV